MNIGHCKWLAKTILYEENIFIAPYHLTKQLFTSGVMLKVSLYKNNLSHLNSELETQN